MYETFFGLAKRPFTLRRDLSFLYPSRQHSLALGMLEFALTGQAGFVVVAGEIGSGKIGAMARSALMRLTCAGLAIGDREYHRTFYFSPEAFRNLFVVHHKFLRVGFVHRFSKQPISTGCDLQGSQTGRLIAIRP